MLPITEFNAIIILYNQETEEKNVDINAKKLIEIKINKVISSLEKNNMSGIYCETRQAALEHVKNLLNDGDTVSMGGTQTAKECGIDTLLKNGNYNFLDRAKEGITPEEIDRIYRETFSADAYITSTNAITAQGELYNVDGNSNRVSAMLFGPKKVIVVAGYNKIVENIDHASIRVKSKAAPANCLRLSCETPCSVTGSCISLQKNPSGICDGCASENRICSNYTIMSRQRRPGRIFVILVGEELGY